MSKKKEKELKQPKEQKRKNKKKIKRQKSIYNVVLIGIFVVFALTFLGTVGGMVWLCINFKDVSEKEVETTMLTSGLTIIGMAISVWTGLNIVNAIEKKDVEQVQQQLAQTEQTIKWISRETRDVKIIKKEQKEIYRGLFLQELLRTNYDAMSRYFYNLFAENKFLSIAEYSHLLLVEQYFSQVYLQYSEKTANKSLIISRIEDGTKKIDEMLNNKQIRPEIEKYLLFRKYEFSFLKGYLFDGIKMYEAFMSAVKGFEKIGTKFGLKKPYSEMDIYEMKYEAEEANLQVAVYFMNAMGEAYSKIIQDTSIKNKCIENDVKILETDLLGYAEKAVKYLELAVKWNQRLDEREVYYRNLGCAYERMDKLKEQFGQHSEQIISNYRKAFHVAVLNGETNTRRIQKIYHTVLSYYERYIKYSLVGKEDEYAFKDISELSKLLMKVKMYRRSLRKHLIDYRCVVELGIADNVRFILPHNMNGLSLTWVVVFILSGDKVIRAEYREDIRYYMHKINNIIETRKVMGLDKNDNWYKELDKRYTVLCEYLYGSGKKTKTVN